jgi:hypothetical protein
VRIAVIGGGLFGSTAAADLARAGHDVTLYERHRELLFGATRANQGRLHRGYHYPRDARAGELWQQAEQFEARFPNAVVRGKSHYVIASDLGGYRRFCDSAQLPWWPGCSPLVRDLPHIAVPETSVNVDRLRWQLRNELTGVRLRFGYDANPEQVAADYDWVVDATYGRHWPEPLRYEVCETVLVQLGPQRTGQGFVVVDGEYCSLDPHGSAHMLYDVVHSVHAVNEVPDHLVPLIDRGLVYTVHSHMDAMLDTARQFFHHLERPVYRGSYFTVRAVLPDDGTDARPTLVRTDGNVIRVLAGKMVAAPWAAREVAKAVSGVLVA